jgi:hypothetical protein
MDHTGINAPFSEATHRANRIVRCPLAIHGCVIQFPGFGGPAPIAAPPLPGWFGRCETLTAARAQRRLSRGILAATGGRRLASVVIENHVRTGAGAANRAAERKLIGWRVAP